MKKITLLDSRLISRINYSGYTIKVIQCGEYFQVYKYSDEHYKKNQQTEKAVYKKHPSNFKKILYGKDNIKNVYTEIYIKKK